MRPGNAHEDCHSKWGIFVGLSCKVHCGKKSHFKHGAKYYSQQHQGKLGIVQLNAMQTTIAKRSDQSGDLIIYSPTGSGKTLAYSFNLLSRINASCTGQLQAIVVAPSRELVMQIYDVMRVLATGCKSRACMVGIVWSTRNARSRLFPILL